MYFIAGIVPDLNMTHLTSEDLEEAICFHSGMLTMFVIPTDFPLYFFYCRIIVVHFPIWIVHRSMICACSLCELTNHGMGEY